MRMMTHILMGMGITSYIATKLACPYNCWILSLLSVIVVNVVIDIVGHYHGLFNPPRRSRITHSLPGVIIISVLVVFLATRGIPMEKHDFIAIYTATISGGISHWFLDALTPSGVYIIRRRFRLAKISYSNPLANAILQIIGALLLILSMINIF